MIDRKSSAIAPNISKSPLGLMRISLNRPSRLQMVEVSWRSWFVCKVVLEESRYNRELMDSSFLVNVTIFKVVGEQTLD